MSLFLYFNQSLTHSEPLKVTLCEHNVAYSSSSLLGHKSLQYYVTIHQNNRLQPRAKLLSQVSALGEQTSDVCVRVCDCVRACVCVCRCWFCYASRGINTQQQQQAGGRILTRLCLPHTRVWSLGNLPAVNHREATQVGEPSSGLTSGVSAEGDLFQRDTPSAANLKRPPLSERRGNAQGKHIFMSEHHSVRTHMHAP